MDVGCYCVSGCRTLAGAEPERVCGRARRRRRRRRRRARRHAALPGRRARPLRLRADLPRRRRSSRPSAPRARFSSPTPGTATTPVIELRRADGSVERIEAGPANSYALELADFEAAVRGDGSRCSAATTRSARPARSRRSTPRQKGTPHARSVEDVPRHLGAGRDGHPLRARRLPARARLGVDGREGPPRGRRPRRPDGRLRVPLPGGARARQPRRGPRRRSTATASTAWPAACTSTRASARAGSSSPDDADPRRGAARSRSTPATSPARSARTSSSGRGSRATTTPSRRPTRESWARLIDGVGAGRRRRCAGHGAQALPRAQELRAGDEDPHAQHRDDAARHPQAARRRGSTTSRSTWTGSTCS